MSWHNQLVLLTGGFQQLGSIVGGVLINAFKPFIQALNSVMGAVINFAQVVSDALGAIFGWEYQTGGGVAQDLEAGAGAAQGIEDATGGAADNAKKLNKYIAGWQEVNNMTSPSASGGTGGGGGGTSGGGPLADGGEWVQKESLWEKYTSSIDSLYKLGEYIGDTLTKAMESIDWDKVYESARGFGSGLASFLNGLISPELFGATGQTIAGALNMAIYAALSFGETFDWEDLGESIAEGVNDFFETFDFGALAKTISKWIRGILKTIISGMEKIDWPLIGIKVGEFLRDIDWEGIILDLSGVIKEAFIALFEVIGGSISVAPVETALILAFAGLKVSPGIIKAINGLSVLSEQIKNAINGIASSKYASLVPIAGGIIALGVAFEKLEDNYLADVAEDINIWLNEIGVYDTAKNIQSSADSIRNLGDAIKEIESNIGEENSNIDLLIEKYFELAEQTELTKAQQMLLKDYANQLTREIPELADQIDPLTGKFIGQKDALLETVQAHKDYMAALAYKDILSEYANELAKAEIELEANAEKYNLCAERLGALNYVMENTKRGSSEQTFALKELGNQWGVQIDTWEEANKYAGAMQEGLDLCTTAEEELSKAVEDGNSKIDIANRKYNEIVGTLDSVQTESSNSAKTIGEQIPNEINTGIEDNPINLSPIKSQIEEEGPNIYAKGEDLAKNCIDGYNDSIEEHEKETEKPITGWIDFILDTVKGMFGINSPSRVFGDYARFVIEGFNNGISNNQGKSKGIIESWVSSITGWFCSKLGINSPSTIFALYGGYTVDGFNNGLSGKQSSTRGVISSWVSKITGWFTSALDINSPSGVFKDFAIFTVEGFNQGIKGEMSSSYGIMKTWSDGIQRNFTMPKLNTYVPKPDFSFGSYKMDGFRTTMQMEMDAKMAEYSFGIRQQNDLLREQNELLRGIYNKPGLSDDDVFNATRRGQNKFQRRTFQTGWAGID